MGGMADVAAKGTFRQAFDRLPPLVQQTVAIGIWWSANIATVLLNKWVFARLAFSFPMALTLIHFSVCYCGAWIVIRWLKWNHHVELSWEDRKSKIAPIAAIYCLSIVLGNVSLRWVPVSFMQTVKAFTPASTVLLQYMLQSKQFPSIVYASLAPVCGGIALSSVTEMSFEWTGFLAALAGCFATSSKTILAENLLKGIERFDSLNTIYHLTPWCIAFLFPLVVGFEMESISMWWADEVVKNGIQSDAVTLLLTSGLLAFALNFSVFLVIGTTSAVTFNIAGNAKIAIAILLSWLIFRNPMNAMNVLGCAITICGCTYYGYVRQRLSEAEKKGAAAGERTTLLPVTTKASS